MIDIAQATHGLLPSTGNQVFTGMAGAAVVGWFLMQVRSLPSKALRLLEQQFTVTLTVHTEDTAFTALSLWLSQQPFARKARQLKVVEYWKDDSDERHTELTAGEGSYVMWRGSRPFLVRRKLLDGKGGDLYSPKRKEDLTVTTFGRSPKPLVDLIEQVRSVFVTKDKIPVYVWAGSNYSLVERRSKRSMDSVYLPVAQKAAILTQVQRFLDGREWYQHRNIPWRMGMSFEGPPGTGKSTLIFTLASHFDKPVYLIPLSTVGNDAALQRAVNEAGAGFVGIEDIDSFSVAEQRAGKARPEAKFCAGGDQPVDVGERSPKEDADDSDGYKLTTSGLLNAIDGIAAREGRVLFITSNHADKLDAALMRPGRIDHRHVIGDAEEEQAMQMYRSFFPDQSDDRFHAEIAPKLPMAPAAVQNLLLGWSRTGWSATGA